MSGHLSQPVPSDQTKKTAPGSGDLAGLVAARLCHDLVSPVGAISNGLDLICEIGASDGQEELEMLSDSAARASALLKFHRVAFGRTGASSDGWTRAQIRDLFTPIFESPRVILRWTGSDGPPLRTVCVSLAAQLALAARAALGMQGTLTIALADDGDLPIGTTAEGSQAELSDLQQAWLSGAPAPLPEPRHVEFATLAHAAEKAGARLVTRAGSGSVQLSAMRD